MSAGISIDLHVHSRFSGYMDDWPLNALGVRESYTRPREVLASAQRRGMDFVTITDHDSIEGALQVANEPNVIVGEEISAFFPEDGAKIHVVALDITESNHIAIQSIRYNVYELLSYLRSRDIFHFVAHPFFKMTRLSIEHFEKMLLLFKTIEVRNGGKSHYPQDLLERILETLTPELIDDLSQKHGIEPIGPKPWIKYQVGGSDDHGGVAVGSTYTTVHAYPTKEAVIAALKCGAMKPAGRYGTPLSVAHQILAVTYRLLQENRHLFDPLRSEDLWGLLGRMLGIPNERKTVSRRVQFFLKAQQIGSRLFGRPLIHGRKTSLKRHVLTFFHEHNDAQHVLINGLEFERNAESTLYDLSKKVTAELAKHTQLSNASDVKSAVPNLLGMLPLILPYTLSFRNESKDREIMRVARHQFLRGVEREHIAVFSDTRFDPANEPQGFHAFASKVSSERSVFSVFDSQSPSIHPTHELTDLPFGIGTIVVPSILRISEELTKNDYHWSYVNSDGPISFVGVILSLFMKIPFYWRFPMAMVRGLDDLAPTQESNRVIQTIFRTILMKASGLVIENEEERINAISMEIPESQLLCVRMSKREHGSRECRRLYTSSDSGIHDRRSHSSFRTSS